MAIFEIVIDVDKARIRKETGIINMELALSEELNELKKIGISVSSITRKRPLLYQAAVYHYGEFHRRELLRSKELAHMVELKAHALLGFNIKKSDHDKKIYAYLDDIDAGSDGISVKYAYAIKNNENQVKEI